VKYVLEACLRLVHYRHICSFWFLSNDGDLAKQYWYIAAWEKLIQDRCYYSFGNNETACWPLEAETIYNIFFPVPWLLILNSSFLLSYLLNFCEKMSLCQTKQGHLIYIHVCRKNVSVKKLKMRRRKRNQWRHLFFTKSNTTWAQRS
jgi:hypothetical protein